MARKLTIIQSRVAAKRRRLALVVDDLARSNAGLAERVGILEVLRRRVAAGRGSEPDTGLYDNDA